VVPSAVMVGVAEAGARPVGGMPWRPRWKAFMRACMSDETLRPVPLLEKVGVGSGLRAALRAPRGVDEGVIPAVTAEVEADRGDRRGGSSGASTAGSEAISPGSDATLEKDGPGEPVNSGVASFTASGAADVMAGRRQSPRARMRGGEAVEEWRGGRAEGFRADG
jgi:hypothetical protein